eukprot:scaffold17067_cov21-Tisochrysis_lutea.AAC.1
MIRLNCVPPNGAVQANRELLRDTRTISSLLHSHPQPPGHCCWLLRLRCPPHSAPPPPAPPP